ncbi:MAG: DUF1489 domain-containing protein [Albidovulum sp.]|nr:DUF1489 domain-containing protein [Albidovulum sp.]
MRLNSVRMSEGSPEECESRINLVKLCVGAHSVQDLEIWQKRRFSDAPPFHLTRMRPKRADDVLNGGSLYWVIDGFIQARQRVVGLDYRMCNDGIRRCAIVFDGNIIRTLRQPRRPFQGWRYLKPQDSPADICSSNVRDDALPDHLDAQLDSIGVVRPRLPNIET